MRVGFRTGALLYGGRAIRDCRRISLSCFDADGGMRWNHGSSCCPSRLHIAFRVGMNCVD